MSICEKKVGKMLLPFLIDKAEAVSVGVCIPGAGCNFTWGSYVTAIYGFSLKAGSILVVMMLIYAGYIYLTSQGDTSKLTSAKDIVIGSILGYILLIMIGAILNYIGIK